MAWIKWLNLERLASITVIATCATLLGVRLLGTPRARPAAPAVPLPTTPIPLEGAAVAGDLTSQVVVLEFADFQCPFCQKFAEEVFPELSAKFIKPGTIRFAYMQFPLEMHARARPASLWAVCSGQQNKYWPFHESAMLPSTNLSDKALRDLARSKGVNVTAAEACVKGPGSRIVDDHVALGQELSVTATPTFFVGRLDNEGRLKANARLVGLQPVSEFQNAIEAASTRR